MLEMSHELGKPEPYFFCVPEPCHKKYLNIFILFLDTPVIPNALIFP